MSAVLLADLIQFSENGARDEQTKDGRGSREGGDDVTTAVLEDGGRGHEPRNGGNL